MTLEEILAGTDVVETNGDLDPEIGSLAYDNRAVTPGALFFCVPGLEADGHRFAPAAVEAGAVALVVERELGLGVPEVRVESVRVAMATIASTYFGNPTADLGVAGITGTNGKTTTAFLLGEILDACNGPCGLIGTVKQVVGGFEEEVVRTTPEAIELQGTFRRMLAAGDRSCVMEVSSHALDLHRCDAIRFRVALFTNLTQDHLDYHEDMEDYFRSKRLLFEMDTGPRVVNIDDPYGRRLTEDFECVGFSAEGAEAADYRALDVEFDAGGARFILEAPQGSFSVTTGLPGHFNVANAIGALAAAVAMGVGLPDAITALAGAARVPGRFEPIDEGQQFAVLVDYAHTPDSLENVLNAARRLTSGRLISVFGAGGDRDRDKRPKMGRAGAGISDLAVITSDNPRSEIPEAIVAEVASGAEGFSGVMTVVDRREAIGRALEIAEPGDTVVIAGKGHEQGQEFENRRKIPFDDRDVAREELRRVAAARAGVGGAP